MKQLWEDSLEWNDKYGWSTPLRSVLLSCGREISLVHIEVARTYGGLLDGAPHKRLNAFKIDKWKYPHGDSDRGKKVNLQIVPYSVEEKIDMQSRDTSFLPPVYMTLWLESDPFDEFNAFSAMKVIYFCNQSDFFDLDMVIQNIVREIRWNEFAVDCMP